MKTVMVTKGLRGRINPIEYHEKCMELVRKYYSEKGEKVEFTQLAGGIQNTFSGNRLQGLGRAIMDELAIADEIVFMDDWEKYSGCRSEHFIASQYGVKCVYLTMEQ